MMQLDDPDGVSCQLKSAEGGFMLHQFVPHSFSSCGGVALKPGPCQSKMVQ